MGDHLPPIRGGSNLRVSSTGDTAVRPQMADKIMSKKYQLEDLGLVSHGPRSGLPPATRQTSALATFLAEEDSPPRSKQAPPPQLPSPSNRLQRSLTQLTHHQRGSPSDKAAPHDSDRPTRSGRGEGPNDADDADVPFATKQRAERQRMMANFSSKGTLNVMPKRDPVVRGAGVPLHAPSTRRPSPSRRAALTPLAMLQRDSRSRGSSDGGERTALGEGLEAMSVASTSQRASPQAGAQGIWVPVGRTFVANMPGAGPVKKDDLENILRVYAEVESVVEGAITVAAIKKYAAIISQDASAAKELGFVVNGIVQSLERTKKEAFSLRDFVRIQYPMAFDEEITALIQSVAKVDRSVLRGRKEGSVPTAADARKELDPARLREVRGIFNSLDKLGRGELRIDTLAEVLSPMGKNVTPDHLMVQFKRIIGPRRNTMGLDDFMVWHVMNSKTEGFIPLDKIQLSMLGPAFVLSSYLHNEEFDERTQELQQARPEGSNIASLVRTGSTESPRPSGSAIPRAPSGAMGAAGSGWGGERQERGMSRMGSGTAAARY